MSDKRARKEIDTAIKHLMAYVDKSDKWRERLEDTARELISKAARTLDVSIDELDEFLSAGPYGHMYFGIAFEETVAVHWHNEPLSLVEQYLEQRGWREGPAGLKYLRALAKSELGFWEITAVQPGAHIDVRPYGSDDPSIRVIEKLASESVEPGEALVTRVLELDRKRIFSGGVLPLSPETAAAVQVQIDDIPGEIREMMDELIAEGEIDAYPDDLEDAIAEARVNDFPGIAVSVWAIDIYDALDLPDFDI